MADYNSQKINTMERLTVFGVRESSKVIKRDLGRRSREIFADLNAGARTLQDTSTKNIRVPMDKTFTAHEFLSVRSGVSDGIQEVSPNDELGLWMNLPDNHDPIKTIDHIYPQFGSKRDKVAKAFIAQSRKLNKFSIAGLRNLLLTDYLSILRTGYRDLSADWIAGEGSMTDVIDMLGLTFGRTKNEATKIFRTETTNYFNTSRGDYFNKETSMDYMQIYSISDGRRSMICEDRHGWVFPIAQFAQRSKKPAFHPYCRTIQRPLTSRLASHRRMIDKGLAMDESKFTPLPKNWG